MRKAQVLIARKFTELLRAECNIAKRAERLRAEPAKVHRVFNQCATACGLALGVCQASQPRWFAPLSRSRLHTRGHTSILMFLSSFKEGGKA